MCWCDPQKRTPWCDNCHTVRPDLVEVFDKISSPNEGPAGDTPLVPSWMPELSTPPLTSATDMAKWALRQQLRAEIVKTLDGFSELRESVPNWSEGRFVVADALIEVFNKERAEQRPSQFRDAIKELDKTIRAGVVICPGISQAEYNAGIDRPVEARMNCENPNAEEHKRRSNPLHCPFCQRDESLSQVGEEFRQVKDTTGCPFKDGLPE